MPILWSDDFSVGRSDLDSQHLHFITLINHLMKLAGLPNSKAEVLLIASRLQDYAEKHFLAEEKLFVQSKYPKADAHRRQHYLFRLQIAKFTHDIEQNRLETAEKMLAFMEEWLVFHILNTDHDYSRYLK